MNKCKREGRLKERKKEREKGKIRGRSVYSSDSWSGINLTP
jgi:hypothetical protein